MSRARVSPANPRDGGNALCGPHGRAQRRGDAQMEMWTYYRHNNSLLSTIHTHALYMPIVSIDTPLVGHPSAWLLTVIIGATATPRKGTTAGVDFLRYVSRAICAMLPICSSSFRVPGAKPLQDKQPKFVHDICKLGPSTMYHRKLLFFRRPTASHSLASF
jgi:hypothetical protein